MTEYEDNWASGGMWPVWNEGGAIYSAKLANLLMHNCTNICMV